MAMPTDFWRNDHMLNLFRTKPCQRLAKDGVCQWKSRCQFSHTCEWARRPPRKHKYSPQICPYIALVPDEKAGSQGGPVLQLKNSCTNGLHCAYAHSMEEVLFHPHIFKTEQCGEMTTHHRPSRGGKRKCHRYYCPFAHGQLEVRESPLSPEQRDTCMRAIEMFPSDTCCRYCNPHRIGKGTSSAGAGSKSSKSSQEPSGHAVGSKVHHDASGLEKTVQTLESDFNGFGLGISMHDGNGYVGQPLSKAHEGNGYGLIQPPLPLPMHGVTMPFPRFGTLLESSVPPPIPPYPPQIDEDQLRVGPKEPFIMPEQPMSLHPREDAVVTAKAPFRMPLGRDKDPFIMPERPFPPREMPPPGAEAAPVEPSADGWTMSNDAAFIAISEDGKATLTPTRPGGRLEYASL